MNEYKKDSGDMDFSICKTEETSIKMSLSKFGKGISSSSTLIFLCSGIVNKGTSKCKEHEVGADERRKILKCKEIICLQPRKYRDIRMRSEEVTMREW